MYNNLNELTCVLCNIKIRNELLWTAHVNGRNHRENLNRLKKKKTEEEKKTSSTILGKRKLSGSSESQTKNNDSGNKIKEPVSVSCTSIPQKGLVISYEELDDTDEEDNAEATGHPQNSSTEPQLPSDFFDKVDNHTPAVVASVLPSNESTNKKGSSAVEALPEGFFDDPVMDAKIRKVEYKDPMDDEWDKFQKTIAEASTVSQALVEENDEESKAERQIVEIDEQIHNWARVEALQRRKESLSLAHEMHSAMSDGEPRTEENNISAENEFDEFLDWRSKETWH